LQANSNHSSRRSSERLFSSVPENDCSCQVQTRLAITNLLLSPKHLLVVLFCSEVLLAGHPRDEIPRDLLRRLRGLARDSGSLDAGSG